MPTNLNDYLLNCRASFHDDVLSEVDSLVFCTISYLHFEYGVFKDTPYGKVIPLPVAVCGILQSDLFGTSWLNDFHGESFMYALMQSDRFMETNVGFYVDDTSDADDMQFSAIAFFLPEKRIYIAFRGTDDSISGWKEDFDLCYKKQTPSQIRGREYVEDIACRFPDHRLYVGGHSKGGNTAEYAALTCDDDVYERIDGVFNHDAPGFFDAPSKRFSTESYNRRLHKTVPQSSVFGMLMEDRTNYEIVHANDIFFNQHAPLNWNVQIDDRKFVRDHALTSDAVAFTSTMNTWAKQHTPDERRRFIELFFEIVRSSGVRTWTEFDAKAIANRVKTIETMASLDAPTRDAFLNMFGEAILIYRDKAVEQIKSSISQTVAGIQDNERPMIEKMQSRVQPTTRPKTKPPANDSANDAKNEDATNE